MDSEELAASGFGVEWFCRAADAGDIRTGQCLGCREVIQIPRGWFADWADAMSGRFPDHDCTAKQHYSDPGPKPYGLDPCICADFWVEGDCVHLPDCPQTSWTCRCGFASWGPTCRDCERPRPPAAPEGR